MNVLVIYFSQTGNTRKVAEAIRLGISETGNECRITPLSGLDMNLLDSNDLIGLGCPVFYYQPPFNVADFLAALPPQHGKQWFVFCSHGSVMGNTLHLMAGHLREKEAKIIASHHTYADATIPFYPYPTLTTGHPDERDLDEARKFGRKLRTCSEMVSQGEKNCNIPEVTETWALTEMSMLTKDVLKRVMPGLSINPDMCNKCGLCEQNCPAKGINTSVNPPRIQDPCIFCWYCAKTCPTCSIEADWSKAVAMAPTIYTKYVKALNDAVKRGEFRWHLDPESINFEEPLYKQRMGAIQKRPDAKSTE